MDGYAVKYQETFGASETSPKKLKLGEQAVYVDTGDPMPDVFNTVIMIEDVNKIKGSRGSKGSRGKRNTATSKYMNPQLHGRM